MISEDIFQQLSATANLFSALMGADTEIALHDLKTRQLVYIVNGHITGREVGYKVDASVYDSIVGLSEKDDLVIGYRSHTPTGRKLRSSHLVIRDKDGEPAALMCVNQDISKWEEFRTLIDDMVNSTSISKQSVPAPEDENYIQKMTQQIIFNTIETAKPSALDTKEAKIEVLRKLETQGVFKVRDAAPIVCKILSISQATLYNYLRELRSQDIL